MPPTQMENTDQKQTPTATTNAATTTTTTTTSDVDNLPIIESEASPSDTSLCAL